MLFFSLSCTLFTLAGGGLVGNGRYGWICEYKVLPECFVFMKQWLLHQPWWGPQYAQAQPSYVILLTGNNERLTSFTSAAQSDLFHIILICLLQKTDKLPLRVTRHYTLADAISTRKSPQNANAACILLCAKTVVSFDFFFSFFFFACVCIKFVRICSLWCGDCVALYYCVTLRFIKWWSVS